MSDQLSQVLADHFRQRAVFWCRQRDGTIVEHVTSAYEGHKGHTRCVPIELKEEGR